MADSEAYNRKMSSETMAQTKKTDKPSKDKWDKLAIVSQLISSIVLASVGGFFTFYFQNNAKNSAIVSDYLSKVVSANPSEREQYLSALDVELGPHYSIPLAIRLATPIQIRNSICGRAVINTKETNDAIEAEFADERSTRGLLQRLASTRAGKTELLAISKSGAVPDADIANAYLGTRSKVYYKVSEVDDYATPEIDANNKRNVNFPTYKFGEESPWVDITDKLTRGTNNTFFLIVSNKSGSSGARLQMRIGIDQYDQYAGTRHGEPAGRLFFFSISIPVDTDGNARLNGGDVVPLDSLSIHEDCK